METLYFEFGTEEECNNELKKHNEELKLKGVRLNTMKEIESFLESHTKKSENN